MKITVNDEMNEDCFEEIYHEEDYGFGKHNLS